MQQPRIYKISAPMAKEDVYKRQEGGGVRLPPSFLKNDGNASIWIKKLLYL